MLNHLKNRAVCYESILLRLHCCPIREGEGHVTESFFFDLKVIYFTKLGFCDWFTCFHNFWLKESCSKWFSAPLPLSRSLNLTGLPEKFLSTSIINRCFIIIAWEEADLGAFLDHREVQDHSSNPWQIPAPLVLVVEVDVLNLRHLHCRNIIPNVLWTLIKAEFPYILWPW